MTTRLHKKISALAANTFAEALRDKVLYGIVLFALLFSAFVLVAGPLSLGEDVHVARSLGLGGLYLFGLIITLFLATSLLYKEIERKTLYFVLSRPATRLELIAGKFAGLLAAVGVTLAGMTAVYLGVVWWDGGGFDSLALLAALYELCELALLIALALFFSAYARPLPALGLLVLFLYMGHSLGLLVAATAKGSVLLHDVTLGLYYLLPNLEKFNLREAVLYGSIPPAVSIAAVVLYAVVYSGLLLWGAARLLERREL